MFSTFFNLISNIKNGVQNAFFSPTVHLSVEDTFFPSIKNTDSSQLYNLKEWVQLFSGSTNCGGTGVFHYASNFLLKDKVNTSHFVHPSLVMQVDTMCM